MKNNFKYTILTVAAMVYLTGCYVKNDPLCNINYIIENKTGHKFTMALKAYDNSSVDSIIILNGETYSFTESGLAGYPYPFYGRIRARSLNVYFDDKFIRSFDRALNREPHEYNFLLESAYPNKTQLKENSIKAVRVMDGVFYKGLLESAKEWNQNEK